MSCAKSVSAPSTPTEQAKQLHVNNVFLKKKGKQSRVHFPKDDILVTCYLEPPDPWSKVYCNTIDTLITGYVATCDKLCIKPLVCVLDQLQEFENSSEKLESNPRAFDFSILGEKLSVKHCEALEEILRRLQFHLVDLEGCYLEDEGAAAFFDMIEYYDSAVHLNISFTKHIDCRGWQACSRMLKKTTSLVHLNARSTGLNEQVLLIVGRALRLGSNLVTLHLENCGIFGRCLVILVAALKLNTTMRELFLAENKISPADGFQLGNLLRTNTHLELLDLSNNKLGDDGLVHVMESLGQQSNTSGRGLSTLTLWNNELTLKGMPCISRALTSARALKRLNLGSNAITSAGILEMKQSFICNRTIEVLELENANITTEGACALSEYLSQNEFIQKLDIRGNDIRLSGLTTLAKSMVENYNVTSLQVDPTPLDLSEPMKDRQHELQEIGRFCQRNKDAKSSLPPQDAQLSTLFNGIFSHVLPLPVSQEDDAVSEPPPRDNKEQPQLSSFKGRFRVSLVVLNNDEDEKSFASRSLSLDPSDADLVAERKLESDQAVPNIISDRLKWLHELNASTNNNSSPLCQTQDIDDDVENKTEPFYDAVTDTSEVFLPSPPIGQKSRASCLTLRFNSSTEQKVRRSSSPTVSVAPPVARKTHSIKCCKELEGLDLRSSVPLSPTRLQESLDFSESDLEVSLNSQAGMKTSQMVH